MKKLLVIIDMQNDFITGCLGTKEAQDIVDKIVEYANNFDGDIIATRDTHTEDYMNTQEGKNLPVVHCIEGSEGWEINDKIKPLVKKVINKGTFGSTTLGSIIKEEAYDQVEFCGVCTDICVISNAILVKAFAPEIPLKVHKDLSAGVTPESHETALEAMKACQIQIV
ncbi:MAG: cysteine hydrolase [Eubacterium sp.]|nr:cysteine hydrolase [Eubacterium sp.]